MVIQHGIKVLVEDLLKNRGEQSTQEDCKRNFS